MGFRCCLPQQTEGVSMDDWRYPDTRIQQLDNPLPYQSPVLPQAGLHDNGRPYGDGRDGRYDNAPGSSMYGWQNGWNQNTQGGPFHTGSWQQSPRRNANRYSITFWALVITGSMLLLMFLFFACWFFLRLTESSGRPAVWFEERVVREEQRSDFWTQEDEREKPKKSTEEYEKDTESIYGTTPDADYYSG